MMNDVPCNLGLGTFGVNLIATVETKVSPTRALLVAVAAYERSAAISVGDHAELVTVTRMEHRARETLGFLFQLLLQNYDPVLRERVTALSVQVYQVPTVERHRFPVRPQNYQTGYHFHVEVLHHILHGLVAEWERGPGHGREVRVERRLVVVARHEHDLEALLLIGRC